MTAEINDVHQLSSNKWAELFDLTDMVQARSPREEMELATMLLEVAKLHVAGQMPQVNAVDNVSGHLTYYSFGHRNVVTADRLFKALGMIDEDGIPLGLSTLPASNGAQKEV